MSLKKAIDKVFKTLKASYKGFKVGSVVKNTNKSCMHYGSIGDVTDIKSLPNNSGFLVYYKVRNKGLNYKPGDVLTKTEDQLEFYSE